MFTLVSRVKLCHNLQASQNISAGNGSFSKTKAGEEKEFIRVGSGSRFTLEIEMGSIDEVHAVFI